MPFRTAVARLGFERRALAMHVPNWTRDSGAGVGLKFLPPSTFYRDDILFCFSMRYKWRNKEEGKENEKSPVDYRFTKNLQSYNLVPNL